MTTQIDGSAVLEIAELARAGGRDASEDLLAAIPLGSARAPIDEFVQVAVIHTSEGEKIVSLREHIEPLLQRPAARKGTAKAQTLQSFIALTNRHKGSTSALFGDLDWRKPSLQAVIDYHDPATVVTPQRELDPFARHMRHRIHYEFPLDEAWQAWVKADGKRFTQVDFAEFLEDRIADLASPTDAEKIDLERQFSTIVATPAQVIELSRGLQVHQGTKVKNQIRLQTGEAQIQFETEHRDASGNLLTVPGLFMIFLPIFVFGERVSLPVRLRYRLDGGEVVWQIKLYKPDVYVTGAVQSAFGRAAIETGLPVYEGAPEV